MSFFDENFDPRADQLFVLNLANINTEDGDFGFIVGADGVFRDLAGKLWYGSQLIQPGDDEFSIDGIAPSGSLRMSFFQDPSAPDLVSQVRALGASLVNGRKLTFFVQPLSGPSEFYAPASPMVPVMTRTMRDITYDLNEAQDRSITLHYESVFEWRRQSRRMIYNEIDHGRLIGGADPSLRFIPTHNFQEEPLFG